MGTAEITREETARRARLLRVREHHVTLDLTRGEDAFGSCSVIRFDCAQPGADSYADLVAQAVHEITLNGVPLDPGACYADGRIALPALAARNELRVVADCAYTRTGTGMHRSTDPADGGVHVYGKFTPAYARTAFACFEQPDLKPSFTFTVTAPAHWTVLSNQPEAAVSAPSHQQEAGRPARTHEFTATPPLPTFATTVVAGDFRVFRGSHVTASGRRVPLELACRASLAGEADPGPVFDVTGQGLDFYTSLLGLDYPYAKYGHAFVPEFSAGATEDPGCVLMSERFLPGRAQTAAAAEMRTMVILHEMAHMWFGDLVTMQWWDDLWLSESFAEFCGHDASVRLGLFPHAWSTFSVSRKAWGIAQDRLPSTHPVAADPATLSEAIANFDGISYAKGAAVLRQLAAHVGEDAFFAGIGDYLRAHAEGNARLPDLLSAVADRCPGLGRAGLATWSKAWLETAGPNTLRPAFAVDAGGRFSAFALLQEAPPAHPVLRPHRVTVGLYSWRGDALVRVGGAVVDADGHRTDVPALHGQPQPDLVLVNDDDRGYVAVRLDPRSLRTAAGSAGQVADPVARAVIWNALLDMTQQAELGVGAFIEAVSRGAGREPSDAVLQALLNRTEAVLARLAAPGVAAQCKQRLADLAARCLPTAAPGSDLQLVWAYLLAATATSPVQLDLVAALHDAPDPDGEPAAGGRQAILSERGPIRGLLVSNDLRWALLRRLAAGGRAGDREIDAMLAADRTGAGEREAAACRAAIPDAAHKDAAWELLTAGTLGAPSATLVARALLLPEHAGLLATYPDRYLAALPRIWATSGGTIRVLLGEILFPYPVVSPPFLARLDELLAGASDPGLVRLLTEQRDIAARALRSRALPDA
ncbi:MAG TPA: aminopeptidase N [Trebonia sp.]|nr:aminopeptidase N [Trebonia sp.]